MSATRSKDRSSLCTFTFADGRRCRMPRQFPLSREGSDHPFLCCFHARREAQAQAAEEVGRDIRFFLSGDYLSVCNLSLALGRVFAAAASGQLKPKTAGTLAYLGQTLLQTIHLAENEYINAFGTDRWRRVIHSHVNENSNYLFPPPPPAQLAPAPLPAAARVPTEAPQQTTALPAPSQSSAPQESKTPAPCSPGFTPAASPNVAAPSINTRHPDAAPVEAGHGSLCVNRLVGAQLHPERSRRNRCALPVAQDPNISNHADALAALNSSSTNPALARSAVEQLPASTVSPCSESADTSATTVSSPARKQLPRSAAHFAATILASAPSSTPHHPRLQATKANPAPRAALPDLPPCSAALPTAVGFTPASSPVTAAPKPVLPPPEGVPPTGPSGAPVLAALPPRNPSPQRAHRGRQIRPWHLPG